MLCLSLVSDYFAVRALLLWKCEFHIPFICVAFELFSPNH